QSRRAATPTGGQADRDGVRPARCPYDRWSRFLPGPPRSATHSGYRSRVRIAHVAPSSERVASGVQTVVDEMVTLLGRRGHEVELWHVGDWTPPLDAETAGRLRSAGVRCRRLASSRRP